MNLPAVVEVKSFMILRDLDDVEKRLEVSIAIGWVKQLLKRNRLELRKSDETVHEEPNVVVAAFLGKSTILGSNLELARLSNLCIPRTKADDLGSNWHHVSHFHRSSSSNSNSLRSNLLL
jgi:hypothetical protein